LWSLGVVLYEMIAGKLPFDGDTESHVIVGILDHEAPRLEPAASLPRGVTKILDRALIKDRNKRYQSAHEMLSDFEALGVTKQRISGIRQFAGLVDSKRRTPAAVFVGVLVALASASAIWWFPLHGRERMVGPTWFEPGPAEQVTFDGNVKTATLSPSGKYLAFTSRVGGQETLHIRNLSAKTEWQLPPYSESTFGLTFSPNSDSLYYVLHDQRDWGRLFSVETQGSIPKMLLDDIDGPVTFSPNGKRFAFMRRSEEKRISVEKIILSEVNDTGNQQELVQKKSTNIGRTLAWSEEHNQIAAFIFSTGLHSSLRASLFLYGPDGSSRSELLSDTTIRSMGSPTWISGSNIVAFMGVSPWRTNNEAALYEAWTGGKTFRAFPSPALAIDSLSSPRDGNILAAIRRTRKASFWVAGKSALDAPREIIPAGDVDTGSFDLFSWDGQDNLIFPSAQSHSIDLMRLSPSGKVDKLSAVQGCTEQAPVYAAAKSALVYTSNCATLGNAHNLWQMNMKTGQILQLTGGSTRDQEPDVARDGSWIVYTTWPSFVPTLWKLPLGGGTPQQISNLQARHPAISPDGQKVLCQIRESYDGRLRYAVMSLATGAIEKEFWDVPISDARVRWEPDGRGIDFLEGEANRIWRKPLPTGRSVPLIPKTADPITDFAWNADGNKLAFVAVHSNADVVLFHRRAVH
jgi:Tol biopolymer transport system component